MLLSVNQKEWTETTCCKGLQNFGIKCHNNFHGTLNRPRCNGPRQLHTIPHNRHLCRPSCPSGNDSIENVKGPQAEKSEPSVNTWSHWHALKLIFLGFWASKASRTRRDRFVEESCLIEACCERSSKLFGLTPISYEPNNGSCGLSHELSWPFSYACPWTGWS